MARTKRNGSALAAIFGATRAAQLTGEAFPSHPIVGHGSLQRLPSEFHSGPLSSLERFSDAYQGSINAGRNIGNAQSRVVVNGSSVIDFLTLGMSMVLEDLGTYVPALAPWLHELEGEIGIPSGRTKLVGFASAEGKGGGLLPHWDAKEGILIQVQGRKRIRLAPNLDAVDPTTSHTPGTRISEELAVQVEGGVPLGPPARKLRVVELRPGSAIYLPRGYWHTTEPLDESLAVAIDFTFPTIAELLLPQLNLALLASAPFRQTVKAAWGSSASFDSRAAELAKLLPSAARILEALDARELLASVDDETRLRFRSAGAQFVCQNIQHSVVRNADDTFDVKIQWFGGLSHTTLNLKAEYLPACEWIFGQKGRFSLRDISTAFPRVKQERLRKLLYFLVQAEALQLAGAGKRQARRA